MTGRETDSWAPPVACMPASGSAGLRTTWILTGVPRRATSMVASFSQVLLAWPGDLDDLGRVALRGGGVGGYFGHRPGRDDLRPHLRDVR